MPVSAGGARYCLMIVVDSTNMGWPVFLLDKSTATVTLGFRTFLKAVNAYGKPTCLRTDHASEFMNNEFQRLMTDNSILREFTSVNGPKRKGRVERKLAPAAEGGVAAFLEFQTMCEGVQFPAKALNYDRMWPEAWTWMCDAFNLMARVDEKPGMLCSFEKFHERPYRGPVLPYMMPGRHKVKRVAKSEPKGEPRFYLNSGNDHASDCSKIKLSPLGTASYSTDVTWGYRHAPLMGEWTTPGGGAAMAGPSSLSKEGAVKSPAQQPKAPQGFEVWYELSTLLTGAPPESSVPQATGTSPESTAPLPAAPTVLTAAAGAVARTARNRCRWSPRPRLRPLQR